MMPAHITVPLYLAAHSSFAAISFYVEAKGLSNICVPGGVQAGPVAVSAAIALNYPMDEGAKVIVFTLGSSFEEIVNALTDHTLNLISRLTLYDKADASLLYGNKDVGLVIVEDKRVGRRYSDNGPYVIRRR